MENQVPRFGWHYTSPKGLFGILSDQAFNLTNIKFLNDPSETDYSFRVLVEALEKYEKHPISEDAKKRIFKATYENRDYEHYTLSMSSDKDSLAMWQYYGSAGYAIKIDVNNFFKYAMVKNLPIDSERENETTTSEVIYDKKKQLEHLNGYLETIFTPETKNLKQVELNIDFFSMKYLEIQRYFKDRAYSHEREFRCTYKIHREDSRKANSYRISATGIVVPYIKVDISSDFQKIVKEIKIHPLIEEDSATHGLELLLESKDFDKIGISKSEIPYREL